VVVVDVVEVEDVVDVVDAEDVVVEDEVVVGDVVVVGPGPFGTQSHTTVSPRRPILSSPSRWPPSKSIAPGP